MESKTAEEFYGDQRKKGLTDKITINPEPDYSLPFYREIFDLMKEYASIKLAEKDKEIERLRSVLNQLPHLIHDSLGETHGQSYTVRDMTGEGEYWITHNEVGSGEPLKQWIKSEIDKSLNK